MTDPEPAGHVPPSGTPLISQADCWRRQRDTLRALAAIHDACPHVPAITWTVSWLGGVSRRQDPQSLWRSTAAVTLPLGNGLARLFDSCYLREFE